MFGSDDGNDDDNGSSGNDGDDNCCYVHDGNVIILWQWKLTVTVTVKRSCDDSDNDDDKNDIDYLDDNHDENYDNDNLCILFSRCNSDVGKNGGRQTVSLGGGCAHHSVILHELGHVVGFWHEQNRPDRDKFVRIIKENIMTSKHPLNLV